MNPKLISQAKFALARQEAQYQQARDQQGLGKPIISVEHFGTRFIAVGGRLYYSKKWKTFHDFLHYYIDLMLTAEWGNTELQLPYEERHPVVKWREQTYKYLKPHMQESGGIFSADMTGAVDAYIGLAYNLYLLAHNEEVQNVMLDRLRHKDQFQGSHYETIVAAMFIKAGFKLEFEDEGDKTSSHCEFTATHNQTGKKFSVEAKSRSAGKKHVDVGNQLHKALHKTAAYERVVFIDINVPDKLSSSEGIGFFEDVIAGMRRRETSLKVRGKSAPPAYVFLTNFAYGYHLADISYPRPVIAEGFKIADFKKDAKFRSLREALKNEQDHREMYDLMGSIDTHNRIPSTFDGEIPEFAFKSDQQRLLIGKRYPLPNNEEKSGVLAHAHVNEAQSSATGLLQSDEGGAYLVSFQLSEDEIKAYRAHPETFFGEKNKDSRAQTPVQLFHFFHDTYKHTPREKLIEFMGTAFESHILEALPRDKLAFMYCEGLVNQAVSEGAFDPKL